MFDNFFFKFLVSLKYCTVPSTKYCLRLKRERERATDSPPTYLSVSISFPSIPRSKRRSPLLISKVDITI